MKRTKTGQHRRVADADVIALVSELSKVCTDQTTAATLNRLGISHGYRQDLASAQRGELCATTIACRTTRRGSPG